MAPQSVRQNLGPSRARHERRKQFFIMAGLYAGLVFSVLLLVSQIMALNILRITDVVISGTRAVLASDVVSMVQKEIATNYLGIFPKNTIFFYPASALTRDIEKEFPRIKDVQFTTDGERRLHIAVTEYVPLGLWCGASPEDLATSTERTPEQCYFIDTTGYIFSLAPQFSGPVFVKFYGTLGSTTDSVPVGKFFAPDAFQNLRFLANGFRALRVTVVTTILASDGHIEFVSQGGGQIFTPSPSFASTTLSALASVLRLQPFASSTEPMKGVDYIDLRYGNKVFYKMRAQ